MANYEISTNVVEANAAIERLMSINGGRGERMVKRLIRAAIQKARKETSQAARQALLAYPRKESSLASLSPNKDPRRAYLAVKSAVYKRVLGGRVDVLPSRRASGRRSAYEPKRRLRDGQKGGNRRSRSPRTEQVDGYVGKDRGFILRFLNKGTEGRKTRYGYRGKLTGSDWFGPSSQRAIIQAEEQLLRDVEEVVKALW